MSPLRTRSRAKSYAIQGISPSTIPDWNAIPSNAKRFERDLEIGGVRDENIAECHRAGNTEAAQRRRR